MLTLAVPSRGSVPPTAQAKPPGRQHPQEWPLEKTIASSSAARSRAITRSARAPTSAGCRRSGTRREKEPAGALGKDLGAFAPFVVAVVPFDRSASSLAMSPKPRVRKWGRAPQRAGENPVKSNALEALAEASRFASPSSVRGRSVRPVCWPLRLHSVSPWRTR